MKMTLGNLSNNRYAGKRILVRGSFDISNGIRNNKDELV